MCSLMDGLYTLYIIQYLQVCHSLSTGHFNLNSTETHQNDATRSALLTSTELNTFEKISE